MKLKVKLIIQYLTISIIPMIFVASLDSSIASAVGVFIVLIVVVMALITAKSITDPIQQLTKLADSISKGELDMEISSQILSSGDEIGELATSIERMRAALKVSMKENEN